MNRSLVFKPLAVALAGSLALSGLLMQTAAYAQPAQQGSNTPNAMQGFSKNRDQPVEITATTFEVRDKDKVATFTGNVHVIQGDTHMRCQTLKVFYEGDTATSGGKPAPKSSSMLAAQPGPEGQGKIKRLEASGGVTVTQNDQVASGNLGVFDMPKNTVTLTGNVVVSQGKNVSRGDRLEVDMTTGRSVMSGSKGVRMLLDPSSKPDTKPKDGASPAPAAPGGRAPTSLQPPR